MYRNTGYLSILSVIKGSYMKCMKCGYENPTTAEYCHMCGTAFTEQQRQEAYDRTIFGKLDRLENLKGWAAHGTAYTICHMKDGKLFEELIGRYDYSVSSDSRTETEKRLINDVDQGSEKAFFTSLQNQYVDLIPFTYNITSISDDDMNDPSSIVSTLMNT